MRAAGDKAKRPPARGRHAAAASRVHEAHRHLVEAMESFNEGFALFDADDRLVTCNARYREMYSAIADELTPGVRFETLVRAMASSPDSLVQPQELESHVKGRMAFHTNPDKPLDVRRQTGQWIRMIDRRTADGWTVAIRIDITDIKRREAILSIVNEAAANLLSGLGWREKTQDMLARLGPAAAVSRVTLSQVTPVDGGLYPGEEVFDLRDDIYEWTAPGVARLSGGGPTKRPYGIPFRDWCERLGRGEVVHGLTRDLSDAKRRWFERQGVLSAVRVPIIIDGAWWGTVGFDHCVEERVWQPLEIDALRAAAGMIALAIKRDESEAERQRLSRLLFEALAVLPQGIAVFDRDRRLQLCNPAFAALYDMTPEAMAGMSVESIVARAVPSVIVADGQKLDTQEIMTRRLSRFGDVSRPMEFQWRDGRWFFVSDHPISSGGIVFVRTDMTEQKRVHETLREGEAFKSAMIDSSLDAIITTDDEGRILEFNPAAERMFGYSRAEAQGRAANDLIVPPHLRERHTGGIIRARAEPGSRQGGRRLEVEAMRKDGSTFPVELAIADVLVGGRHIFTAYIRDISERQRMERALRESEQRFRGVAEAHPIPVVIVSDGLVVYASPSTQRLFGQANFVNTPAAAYYADMADRQRFMEALNANGMVENFETRMRKIDGTVFPAALTSRRIVWEGKPAIITGILDLTEAKRAEAEIARQREALAHSEKL